MQSIAPVKSFCDIVLLIILFTIVFCLQNDVVQNSSYIILQMLESILGCKWYFMCCGILIILT